MKGVTYTFCGETAFKSLRYNSARNEYESVRRIGGLIAVPENEFFPNHDACTRCAKLWFKL